MYNVKQSMGAGADCADVASGPEGCLGEAVLEFDAWLPAPLSATGRGAAAREP
jgi:hypothetical protein